MKVNTYACDVCHTQKKETNHWWAGTLMGKQLTLVPFDGETEKLEGTNHLCGAECLSKWAATSAAGVQ